MADHDDSREPSQQAVEIVDSLMTSFVQAGVINPDFAFTDAERGHLLDLADLRLSELEYRVPALTAAELRLFVHTAVEQRVSGEEGDLLLRVLTRYTALTEEDALDIVGYELVEQLDKIADRLHADSASRGRVGQRRLGMDRDIATLWQFWR